MKTAGTLGKTWYTVWVHVGIQRDVRRHTDCLVSTLMIKGIVFTCTFMFMLFPTLFMLVGKVLQCHEHNI